MTSTSLHGATTRRPVYSGNRRVPGLSERTLADGSTVYDAAIWTGGRSRRFRLQAATKTDAIAEVRALTVDLQRGEGHRSPAAGLTVADVAADWLAHLDGRTRDRDPRRRYSARTVGLYRQRLAQHVLPALGHRPIADVTLADVRRLADALGAANLAPSTATGTVGILSGLLRFAVKGGMLERNPVRDLDRDDRPGVGRLTEPRYLTADELARLLDGLTDTFRPVAAVCAYAGLRVSETLGLTWGNLDLRAGTLTVDGQLGAAGERVPVKTAASAATVPMLPALARELRDHRARQAGRDLRRVHADALVFTTARGRPQSRRNALRAVQTAAGHGRPERRRTRARRPSRPPTFVRRARPRRGPLARGDGRARPTRKRPRHGAGVRGACRRRTRARVREAGGNRVRFVDARGLVSTDTEPRGRKRRPCQILATRPLALED